MVISVQLSPSARSSHCRPFGRCFCPSQYRTETPKQSFRVACLAFSNDADAPTESPELPLGQSVPLDRRVELVVPEVLVCGRTVGLSTSRVLMSETPVHKDDESESPQNQVGFAGKLLDVQSEPVPHAVHHRADQFLRFRVLAPYQGYDPAACRLVEDVGHGAVTTTSWSGSPLGSVVPRGLFCGTNCRGLLG